MRFLPSILVLVSLSVPSYTPVGGQSIQGLVLVEGETVGVEGASVTLAGPDGEAQFQVQTNASGEFWLSLEGPGMYSLRADRLGFQTTHASVEVGEREMVEVELRMAEEAIPLDPLIITARRVIQQGTLDEYYDRMERNRRRGVGQFITREEWENSPAATTTMEMARVPGLYLVSSSRSVGSGSSGHSIQMRDPLRGGYCTPDYYLNGMPTSWERLPPMEDIEGVEIYEGRFEGVEGYWPSNCGAVFMWRRADWGEPFAWSRLGIAAIFAAIVVLVIGLG